MTKRSRYCERKENKAKSVEGLDGRVSVEPNPHHSEGRSEFRPGRIKVRASKKSLNEHVEDEPEVLHFSVGGVLE